MNKWISAWVKNNYANAKRDLCTCFVDRGFTLANDRGHISMITASSWMFISSFEEFRKSLLRRSSITSMIQQSTHGYAGVTVPTTMFVLAEGAQGVTGTYIRLEDFDRPQWQEPRALEALADPDCGWFYRRNSETFAAIPGTPIVYWVSNAITAAFRKGIPVSEIGQPRQGLATGENARFVRQWWEVSLNREWFECSSIEESVCSGKKWFPYNKGGEYRKWYGNNEWVINWKNDGEDVRAFSGSVIRNPQCYFKPSITWSKISSGSIAFRYKPKGHVFDVAGTSIFASEEELKYLHGVCNSAVILKIAKMLSPTLNFEVGQIATYPVIRDDSSFDEVVSLVEELRLRSRQDWDSFEESWNFGRHPLI